MIRSSQLPLFPALRRGLSHTHMDPVLCPIEAFFFVTFQNENQQLLRSTTTIV